MPPTEVNALAPDEYPEDWWEQIGEPPPEDDSQTAVPKSERAELEVEEFWKARPILAHLHQFARARRVGPWAVLGTALARTVAACPPQLQVPPVVGSYASLNLFIGLVGSSGDGKDIARRVAKEAFDLGAEHDTFTAPLGSGEGLSHMFMRKPDRGEDGPQQHRVRALVTVGEIDTLSALANRQSSTIAAQLRQAAMGEQLGFFYSDEAKRMMVPEHAYRLCLIAGIQPERSAVLLDDADGGTPQRFVWLPAGDPTAPDYPPPEPTPMIWEAPDWARDATRAHSGNEVRWPMGLPEVARKTVVEARLQRLRGVGGALDAHALLTREKVAFGLGLMEGRLNASEEDWELSGVIMLVSDSQRERCARALASAAANSNRGKAVAEAERAAVVEEHLDVERVKKAAASIRRRLRVMGDAGASASDLRKVLASKDRPYFESAVDALQIAGEVNAEVIEYQGQRGTRYKIC